MCNEHIKRVYTMNEAASILRIGRNLAYKMAKSGELPTIQLGRRKLVPAVALEALLAQPVK